jgi:dTDP-D-glucose 4,6-dehydratase
MFNKSTSQACTPQYRVGEGLKETMAWYVNQHKAQQQI